MDKRWYLDLNSFAKTTTGAHGFMTAYLDRFPAPVGVGLVVLALLVLAAWWSARGNPERLPAVVWAAVGAVLALGLDEILVRALAKPFPYQVLAKVEVLVPRSSAHVALPSTHAAVAGAVVAGLALARRWWLAGAATLATLLLLFAGVYTGAAYPSDVAAGAGFGLVVAIVLWPLGAWLLNPVVHSLSAGSLGWLVASKAAGRRAGPGFAVNGPRRLGLPDARAMDALRVATQAARNTQPAPSVSPGPLHARILKRAVVPEGAKPGPGEAS